MTTNHLPMSMAFISAAVKVRVSAAATMRHESLWAEQDAAFDDAPLLVRIMPRLDRTIWLAPLGEGHALVQADAEIKVGYRVYFPAPDGSGHLETPKIVAAIDGATRSNTKEWIITWVGAPPGQLATEVAVPLSPLLFALPLLRWVYETADGGAGAVDLSGFGAGDVVLDSAASLADHLASGGLLHVIRSGAHVTVALTEQGAATAARAVVERADQRLRAETLRNAMIVWLADREIGSDEPCDWEDMLFDPAATFAGDFFTIRELRRRAENLAEMGFIRATPDRSGNDLGWTNPRLTAKGLNCINNFGGNVAESLKPETPSGQPTYNVITMGDNNQVNFGDRATQTVAPPAADEPSKPQDPAQVTAGSAPRPTQRAKAGVQALGVVFVHGILSKPSMWDGFAGLIAGDGQLAAVKVAEPSPRFGYATGLVRWDPRQSIPSLDTAADSLKEYLVTEAGGYESLVLVGHSQGGLVIQRCLVRMLAEGRGRELERIRHVVLLACPNTGSQFLLSLRRRFLWRNAQERALRPFDELLADTRRTLMRDIVHAREVTERTCPIPFAVYAGESDGVVSPASARDAFPQAAALPGGHKTIARPDSREHRTYATLKRLLLEVADLSGPSSSSRENR